MKTYKEFITESELNEDLLTILATLHVGVAAFSIFSMLMTFANHYILNKKDREVKNYLDPRNIKQAWEIYKEDKKLVAIINRLKEDEDIKKFIKSPKRGEWRNLLSTKLKDNEKDMLRKVFQKDIPIKYSN